MTHNVDFGHFAEFQRNRQPHNFETHQDRPFSVVPRFFSRGADSVGPLKKKSIQIMNSPFNNGTISVVRYQKVFSDFSI